MARLRKGVAYRRIERPYTRISKFRKKSFIKTTYNSRVTRFVMGNVQKEVFDYELKLIAKEDFQARSNSLEAARMSANKLLETNIPQSDYFLRVTKYPFHILRLHALASGAGADRFSTGMAHAFGKPAGQAAQVRRGETVFQVNVDKKNLETGIKALKRASHKLAVGCYITVNERKVAAK